MPHQRIFLSCVTSEYKDLRDSLSRYLGKADCDVKFQEEFSQSPLDTLEKLDGYIRTCDAVLHLIGTRPGALAAPHTVSAYLEKKPDFLTQDPELRTALGDCSGLSYTQWEAYLARHHRVPLFVYAAEGTEETESGPELRGHRLRLENIGRYSQSFQSREDLFGQLIGDLRDILPQLRPWKPRNLPEGSIGRYFKGRDAAMEKLEALLAAGDGKAAAVTATQAIHGLGGVGKTRLAIEYAHCFASRYSAVLFIKSESPENLNRNLASLADPMVLDLPEYDRPEEDVRRRAVLHWLQQHPGWLLILDNVDTSEAKDDVENQLGSLQGGRVLITSRLGSWSGQVKALELDMLDTEAAISFLKERTEGRRMPDPDEDMTLKILAEELDGLALALEQAGAHIAHRRISFSTYLGYWRQERQKALAWYDGKNMRYPLPVAAAWQASFDQLGQEARDLLEVLALFSPSPIPRALFAERDDALVELMDYSLVRPQAEPPDTFTVHRLVQDVVRDRVEREGRSVARNEESLCLLAKGVPENGNEPNTWKQWELLAQHLHLFLNREANWQVKTIPMANIMKHFAEFLQYRIGSYDESEILHRRALEIQEQIIGHEHPDTLSSINNLGLLLKSKGAYVEAEVLYRRALEEYQRVFGPEHPGTLAAMSNVAAILQVTGTFDDAEDMLRIALEGCERVLGSEHPDTLANLSNLAYSFDNRGAHDLAEPLNNRVLEIRIRKLGPEHPDTLTSMNNLAFTLDSKGAHDLAAPLFIRALKVREKTLGPEHPDTLTSLNNLANFLEDRGAHDEAEPLFIRALDARRRVLGPDHPDSLASLNNLACFHLRKGDFHQAEPQFRRALDGYERSFGSQHPDTLLCVDNLARLLEIRGLFNQAEPLYRRVLEGFEKIFHKDHPKVANARKNLSKCNSSVRPD